MLRNRMAVVIDHTEAKIYRIEDAHLELGHLEPADNGEINHHHLRQKHSAYDGQRVPEDKQYYGKICQALKYAQEILIISHGKGKSSAGLMLIKYIAKHHHELMQLIIGFESLEQLSDKQLVAHARHVFSNAEHRCALGFTPPFNE
ncbi:MAG: hypothetical protein PUP46_10740 [Endozoicomonas sp. (ex Botrylloides leachii)]|nr:hypothetical protein [Endozoicomonas sp. (ex Botrylloides leachii)]